MELLREAGKELKLKLGRKLETKCRLILRIKQGRFVNKEIKSIGNRLGV